jgi:hypothetical protein
MCEPIYIFSSGIIYKIEAEQYEPATLFKERIKWITLKLKQDSDISKLIISSKIWSNSKFLGVKYSAEVEKEFSN